MVIHYSHKNGERRKLSRIKKSKDMPGDRRKESNLPGITQAWRLSPHEDWIDPEDIRRLSTREQTRVTTPEADLSVDSARGTGSGTDDSDADTDLDEIGRPPIE